MTYFEHITQVSEHTQEDISEWALSARLEYMKDTLKNVDKPFIVFFGGIPQIKLSNKDSGGVYNVESYLLSLTELKEDECNLYKLKSITNEDKEWTKNRNEGLRYTVYRKFTLKPEIQKIAAKEFKEAVLRLEEFKAQLEKNRSKKELEMKRLKALYSIGRVYSKRLPKGGEGGVDGFIDAEIVNNNTNEVIRFIVKDVFDFGVFSFPKRLGGSDDVFKREVWNDEEQNIAVWLSKFNPFSSGVRM